MPPREPPIILPPPNPPSNPAALIFLHGLSDSGSGLSNLGTQLQSLPSLSHIKYIFPNALENRDMMTPAWYLQSRLTAAPAPRPELEDDEDEDGMVQSIMYVESLISELENEGISLSRIVLGGFSQGMALSLLLNLISSKYAGRLAGILAVCGYLPLLKDIPRLQSEYGIQVEERFPGPTRVMVLRGKRDQLVPKRYGDLVRGTLKGFGYREELLPCDENGRVLTVEDAKATKAADAEKGIGEEKKRANLVVHEYEGVGHTITGGMISDVARWLEEVLPAEA